MQKPDSPSPPFHGSYLPTDATLLLKPIDPDYTDVAKKEALIQSGQRHYSEMLSVEYQPSAAYLSVFHAALQRNREKLATHVLALAAWLNQRDNLVLVSLARAGTPVGVLLRRILREKFQREVPHYSISIIRDRGVDENALHYLLAQHDAAGRDLVFIDGWTGKGVIARELHHWVERFNQQHGTQIDSRLYVLADISGCAAVAATLEDYLIPSALLNATISGLISRSILNTDYIGANDFHGCRFYHDLQPADLSLWYIDQIMDSLHSLETPPALCVTAADSEHRRQHSADFIKWAMAEYRIAHVNHLKPGLGEAIRVLLRRVPERILLKSTDSADVQPFLVLAEEKQVPIEIVADMPYQAAGVIAYV